MEGTKTLLSPARCRECERVQLWICCHSLLELDGYNQVYTLGSVEGVGGEIIHRKTRGWRLEPWLARGKLPLEDVPHLLGWGRTRAGCAAGSRDVGGDNRLLGLISGLRCGMARDHLIEWTPERYPLDSGCLCEHSATTVNLRYIRSPPFSSCIPSLTEGLDLARYFGAACIETSAKQRINVDEAFMELVRAIRRYNKVSVYTDAGGWIHVFISAASQ